MTASDQPFIDKDAGEGERHREQQEKWDLLFAARLVDQSKNLECDGLRLAGDVTGKDDGGAKLAEAACECQQHAGHNPLPGERQRDTEKQAELALAQHPSSSSSC